MTRNIALGMSSIGLLFLMVLGSSTASAVGWPEVGDAGDLPGTAQATQGNGNLDFVSGTIFTSLDKDMFEIKISNAAIFTAVVVVGNSLLDTQVFLLNSAGAGVYANDDPNGIDQLSILPSGDPSGPVLNGTYYLVISGPDNDPTSLGAEVFDDINPGVQAPVIAGVVDGWTPTFSVFGGTYQVSLTGAEFASAAVPSMGNRGLGFLILALAAGSFWFLRPRSIDRFGT